MIDSLDRARRIGLIGYNHYLENADWPDPGPNYWLMARMHDDTDGMIIALREGNREEIIRKAADVAISAMFIADANRCIEAPQKPSGSQTSSASRTEVF